ncbi:glycosyltransferase [Tessaracoccus caeni]|uniref:glycosyltransferase n=1 Tax=Tessaracoccus caeni TaxID=3031239 RepID=UPI0023D9EBFB|nr:glycosyltransferase [Tessaracoccus caeni]MDF1489040.1 glycosyltransferase [Tessaracoccus caeni]
MHVAFFSDQHPATLGGLQVSLGLQREYLEAAGHTVTVCSPDSKRRPSPQYSRDGDVLLRAMQVGEHSFRFTGPSADRATDAGFDDRPPVDVVHVQADAWGAWNGYRFARRHGLPVVHTMHTNIELGVPGVVPFPQAAFRLMCAAQQRHLRTPVPDMAGYMRAFSETADAVIVPSSHFARRLRDYGIDRELHVIPTGVDDRQIDVAWTEMRARRERPVLMWPGRISEEKRLDDVLRAFAYSQIDAELHVYGSGPGLRHCESLTNLLGIAHLVRFHGTVSHDAILRAMRQADAVIQSSLGYETQGLTVYEAISVGTPVLVRDPAIAYDLPAAWRHTVMDASVEALSHALKELPDMLATGRLADPGSPQAQFRQSSITGRILDVYEATIAEHRDPWRDADLRLRVA